MLLTMHGVSVRDSLSLVSSRCYLWYILMYKSLPKKRVPLWSKIVYLRVSRRWFFWGLVLDASLGLCYVW